MRKSIPCVAAVLMTLLGRSSVQASWRIDAEGGAFVPVSKVSINTPDGNVDAGVNAGGSFAAGAGYGIGDWFEPTAHFQGNFAGLAVPFGEELQVYSLTGGGRVYLTEPQMVRPWLTSEIGWYHANFNETGLFSSSNSTANSFGLNAGAGVDVAVSPTVSLGVDARYNNAFNAFKGIQFVTTMLNVGIHLGQ